MKISNKFKDEELIKIKATPVNYIYPRPPEPVYKNEDDCYGVIVWEVIEGNNKVQDNYRGEIKIKGNYINNIKNSVTYNLLIKEVVHPQYGLQYDLVCYNEIIDFKNLNNQRGFLKTILTDNLVENFFKAYENPLEIIASGDVEKIKKVKGIGPYIANRLLRDFEATKDLSIVYAELDKMGISTNFISRLIAHYKSPQKVIDMVKDNTYQIIEDVDGVGFITADNWALAGGLEATSEKRIKAFILYHLEEEARNNGKSFIATTSLLSSIYNNLGDSEDILVYYDENNKSNNNINNAIQELKNENKITIEVLENGSRRVYLNKYYKLEKDIAYNLKRIRDGKSYFKFDHIEEKIHEAEEKQGFEFTDEQKEGIKLGIENQLCLITGAAGSGKSSVLTGILSVLDNYTFAQCALSGAASARMEEITGHTGQTIHRLLGYNPASGGFMYNKDNPLNFDIIVLDEISLVGGDIFLSLLEAIPTGAKLYILGDPGQLEAIGPLNLADNMMKSNELSKVELTKVHRQAQKSGILTTAYDIRNGIQLFDEYDYDGTEIRGELNDMILEVTNDREKNFDLFLNYFEKYYNSDLIDQDVMRIQAISPIKERGDCSVFKLNKAIQEIVNPKSNNRLSMLIKRKQSKDDEMDRSFEIREGDKVMCIKNNYKALATPNGEVTTSIFNGWTGIVTMISPEFVTVNFPLSTYKEIFIPFKEVGNYITLGYCSTTHKLQGQGYDVIIGNIDYTTPPRMLNRQQVYTMITRAKKLCVLVAQNTALRRCIGNDFVSEKETFLPEFLEWETDDLKKG